MAIRTASQRAQMIGEGEFRKKIGNHLIKITKHGGTCPLCAKWEGRVLIDDVYSGGTREDGNYPLLSEAMAAGLYHPRCRHGAGTYYPEIEDVFGDYKIDNIKTSLNNKNKSGIIKEEYTYYDDLHKAKKHLNDKLGIECENYEKLPLNVANMLNQELESAYKKFGNLSEIGSLKKIKITQERSESYAAYNRNTKEILLNPDNLNLDEMLEAAKFNKKYGYWSTDDVAHSIRHEIGHSVGYGYVHKSKTAFINRDKADEIAMLLMDAENKCGIKNINAATSAEKKTAGNILSFYGLYSEQEFIAEAVAEYMNGNPRDTAKKVIEIIMRGMK